MELSNTEIVTKVLERSGCLNSREISIFAKNWFNYDVSPSSVGGALRSLMIKNKVASSNCGNGAAVYWLI